MRVHEVTLEPELWLEIEEAEQGGLVLHGEFTVDDVLVIVAKFFPHESKAMTLLASVQRIYRSQGLMAGWCSLWVRVLAEEQGGGWRPVG